MNRGRFRAVNPEISRASTVLFDDVAELRATYEAMRAGDRTMTTYGTLGTPTTRALEDVLVAREGGDGAVFAASGLGSIAVTVFAFVRAGDHVLVTDSVYAPARRLFDRIVAGLGVEVEYYDPLIGAGIAERIRPTTSVVWLESPGSHTFEIQDVPAIVAAARAAEASGTADTPDRRIVTVIDHTWGAPGLFRPFDHGVDVSIVALTKYWAGHSDVLMGATFARDRDLPRIREAAELLGQCANGEDTWLVLRGSRTVDLRLAACGASALELARRLEAHPRIGQVLHPGLPSFPGHELWRRDFHGSSGLFAIELLGRAGGPASEAEVDGFVDRLVARGPFALGYSWGGFESLVMPGHLSEMVRSVRPWTGGPLVRLNIGVEPVESLWAALEAALA